MFQAFDPATFSKERSNKAHSDHSFSTYVKFSEKLTFLKAAVMQIEKALINDCLRVSTVS